MAEQADEPLAKKHQRADAKAPPPKMVEGRIPQPLGGLFTRSLDGWAVDPNWLGQIALNDDKILQLEGYAPDLKLFDSLLDDDIAMSTFQQRRLDVISKDWEVEPGDSDSQSKKAADHLRANLKRIRWDNICDKMLHSVWYGYGVGEADWAIDRDGLLALNGIVVPNRAWFAFTNAGELVMRSNEKPEGVPVPDRKFWYMRTGGSHDGQHYGVGLAHWCYWPIYFKKNVIKFWALFLEKFGMPTMMGKFPTGWENDDEKINALLASLAAIGTDSAVAIPVDAEVEAMEGTRSGSGASSYDQFVEKMNTALTRVILSQTMTSEAGPAGLGSGQAEVQEDKGLAIAQADSDLLHESFNNSIARWMTEWNFPGAAVPRVYRKLQDEEDLNSLAERDGKLDALGWQRTDKSFVEVYGQGYERKPKPEGLLDADGNPVPPALPGQQPQPRQLTDQRKKQNEFAAQFAAHDPRPLYIQRKLVNADEFLRWAKGQGFDETLSADDLHVTLLYCRTPVDWFKIGQHGIWGDGKLTVPPGGPRVVEPLGDKGAVVLQFASGELEWRHRELLESGASHSFPNYWPHVTITYDPGAVDLDKVEPYRGKLVFGPEIWEELDAPDEQILPPVKFAADEQDAIDRLVDALGANGQAAITAMLAPLKEAVAGLGESPSPEALRVALLEATERMKPDQLAAILADPLLAVRAAEESGLGADKVA